MPANSLTLPAQYTASSVMCVTRGFPSRPTVYFKDFARFTQAHARENNIGFHEPPRQQVLFANLPVSEISQFYRYSETQQRTVLRSNESIERLLEELDEGPAGDSEEEMRLFELKLKGNSGRYISHQSRGVAFDVGIVEAHKLLVELRSRGTEKFVIRDDPNPRKRIWAFKDAV